ncbi:MAG: hypothetical protein V3U20_08190 [Thermoplasmata archaeon]
MEITIYSNDTANISSLNLASQIQQALDTKFRDEVEKDFVVRIILQTVDVFP